MFLLLCYSHCNNTTIFSVIFGMPIYLKFHCYILTSWLSIVLVTATFFICQKCMFIEYNMNRIIQNNAVNISSCSMLDIRKRNVLLSPDPPDPKY